MATEDKKPKKTTSTKRKTTATKKPVKKAVSTKKKAPTKTTKKTTTKKTTNKKKKVSPRQVKKDIKNVEKKMDAAMNSVAKKISPKAQQQAKKILDSADAVAGKVDTVVDQVDSLADSFLPHGTGSTSSFQIERSPKISRLFIFRFLWMIIQYFVLIVRGLWISVLTVVHILYMLVFGKRERNLRERQVRFKNHVVKWEAYLSGLTNERPDIITPKG